MLSIHTDEFLNAIRSGDLARINQLLEASPTLASTKDKTGVSAILFALYNGHKEIAKTIAVRKRETDIFEAASLGNLDRVKSLVKENPFLVDAYSPDGFTALGLAAYLGQKETMEYILEKGANVNAPAKNPTRYTALTGAVSQNHNEIAKLLVREGADVNHRYEGGFTPLVHAAYVGNVELVTFLLEHGADPNARVEDGKTPSAFAGEKGHDKIVELLSKYVAK